MTRTMKTAVVHEFRRKLAVEALATLRHRLAALPARQPARGVDTPDGFENHAPGRLAASTVDRHLRRLGYNHERMIRQPPAVRFQAEHSNALWHFDMSPSDLKHLKAPPWIDADRPGAPTLMLFSVVDDRSGGAYQEYRCVYGEDVERALRFLFNAMTGNEAAESGEGDPFQGLPAQRQYPRGHSDRPPRPLGSGRAAPVDTF